MDLPSRALLSELVAHYAPYRWFAAAWLLPLLALSLLGVRFAARGAAEAPAGDRSRSFEPTTGLVPAAVVLIAFVSMYAFLILYHEDLVGTDYAQLTGGATPFVSVPIWPESGRFFPLGLQEYSLLGLFGRSATLFHAFSIVELCIVAVCVFRILDTTPMWFRCAVATFTMALPSFVHSWFGLVIPERDMLVWLSIWLVCLQSFIRTHSRTAFCAALLSAQFALYYKETAFVLIGSYAGARLVLCAWRQARLAGPTQWGRFARMHALELAHLGLCVVFVAVYYFAIARHVTASYVGTHSGASAAALGEYFRTDPLIGALSIALAWRLIANRINHQPLDAFWDPLAIAALTYAFAYVALGLSRDYYLTPADFLAVIYIARFGYDAISANRRAIVVAAALVVGWVFQRNVRNAAFEIVNRKEFVEGNARLASFLQHYSRSTGRTNLSLFFPQAGGFQLMEFSAYLRYKGLTPMIAHRGDVNVGPTFAVKSPHRFPDDLCQPSQAFLCSFDSTPDSNDLVVFLPGRQVAERDLDSLRARASELFHDRGEPTAVERVLESIAPSDRMAERPTTEAFVFRY